MEDSRVSKFKKLILYIIEYICPFNVKFFQIVAGIMTALLLSIVMLLGWISTKKIKETVIEDFNKQQLLIAKHASSQIENNFKTIKKELLILSMDPSIQYSESSTIAKRIGITFASISEYGIQEIRFIDIIKKKTYTMDYQGYRILPIKPEEEFYIDWGRPKKNKGNVLVEDIRSKVYLDGKLRQIMSIATPVWQESVDKTHPVASYRHVGTLLFAFDAPAIVGNVAKSIQSGRTGYSWVINSNAIFLYHPVEDFIGKNAFKVRHQRKPVISFNKINEIQKEKMLAGREGTGTYISGWHRELEGKIHKLIAYNPIYLSGGSVSRHWSIAVVAPISEVEGAIHAVYIRQFLFQTIVSLGIVFGGATIFFLIFSWSSQLGEEVERRTADLKNSEERYKSLIENAEDIIFTVDYKGRYLSINNYGAQMFHKTPEDIIGSKMTEIQPHESTNKQVSMIKDVFVTGSSNQMTYSIIIENSEHWFSTNFSPLINEENEIYAVLGITRDITHRKKIEEQEYYYYTEKLASLGTLAAGVAHEINNPLAIILGHTDVLLEKTDKDSLLYKNLKTIEKQGLNAKRIVESLLSFSSFSEKKEEWIDVNMDLDRVIKVVGDTLLINKITLEKKLSSDLPKVRANSEEIQQVFFNLINNAIYAMKADGGTLTIITKPIENREKVKIQITDTGYGIKKEIIGKIFDPLFTTKKPGEGTGLGLSVSYGIITKYKGTLTFQSITKEEAREGQQSGTTFTVMLPAISIQDFSEKLDHKLEIDTRTAISNATARYSEVEISKPNGKGHGNIVRSTDSKR